MQRGANISIKLKRLLMFAKRQRFAAAFQPRLFRNDVPGHTTRAPPVGFESGTNGIQLYAIVNLDKTSLCFINDVLVY